MCELPEVETVRAWVEPVLVGHRIERAEILDVTFETAESARRCVGSSSLARKVVAVLVPARAR